MSKGKRYNGEKKLNLKKVFAVILVIVIIIMFVLILSKLLKQRSNIEEKAFQNGYITIYENQKWGVINSKGEQIIKPTYDEMIIIPDTQKDIFLCTYDVNYENNTYKTTVLNSKGETIFKDYDNITAIENHDNSYNLWYEKNVLKVEKDGKYGVINLEGKELLPCEYDEIDTIKPIKNVLITKKDNKYGLADEIGNIIIENNYETITALTDKYENGFIIKNDKYGIINYDKKQILETKYDEIKNIYGNNMYVVKENGTWKVINKEAQTILQEKAETIVAINGDNFIVEENGKYGLISKEGTQKIASEYEELKYAFEDYYIAKKGEKYGLIDTLGQTRIDFKYNSLIYNEIANYLEGENTDITQDLIDSNLQVKTSGIVSEVNTEKNYVKLRQGSDYKYYNFKLEEKQSKDLLTGNSLYLHKKDGKYGYVDKNGIVIVDYIYDDATEQNKYGYASVKKDGKWGAIDYKGKTVVEPTYTLENNLIIDFIGTYHIAEDLNANYYTK